MSGSIDFDALVLTPCMAIFGQTCTYQPAAQAITVPITGVFEEFHVTVRETGADTQVLDTRPVLGTQASQFPGGVPPLDEELITTADGRVWMIDEVMADGVGHLKIMLKVAPNGMPAVSA